MAALALEGTRVIDLTYSYAGPFMARLLADMGAQVIKVESTQRPELTRPLILTDNDLGEEYWNRGGYFNLGHRNKYAITLNLTMDQGKDLLKELVKLSDVLLEAYSPRVMGNLGLDYDVLKQIKPDLIMMSLSGYGQTGPKRNFASFGTTMESQAGIAQLTGYRDGGPVKTGISYCDPITGIMGAGLVTAALCHRNKTGEGTHIDLSMYETGASFVGETVMDHAMNGRIAERMGNRHPYMAPHGCYPCAGDDQWVTIAVGSEKEWQALCNAMGDPAWAREERFSDPLERLRHQDELDEKIGQWTRGSDHREVMEILQAAGVAAGAVLNNKELLFDRHLKARSFLEVVDHPRAGKRPYAGMMFKLSKTPGNIRMPAPLLGQHNHYILKELLNLDDERIRRLEEEGVMGTVPAAAQLMGVQLTMEQYQELLCMPEEQLMRVGALVRKEENFLEQLGLKKGQEGGES